MPTKVNSANSPKKAPAAPADSAIGRVETVDGDCTVTHVGGAKAALTKDAPILQGDLVETGANGKISTLFVDSSTFALGNDGSMVMDELVYDPKSHNGHALANITKGVFVDVSGEIASNNPDKVSIHTPVMTIGIRGTKVAGVAAPEGQENKVALLPEEDGSVGKVVVATQAGSVVLDAANELTKAVFGNVLPSVPEVVAQAVVNELFGEAISAVPFLNDLGGATGVLGTITDLLGGSDSGGSSSSSQSSGSRNAVSGEEKSNDSGGGVTDLLDKLFHHDPHMPSWLDDRSSSIDHLFGEHEFAALGPHHGLIAPSTGHTLHDGADINLSALISGPLG